MKLISHLAIVASVLFCLDAKAEMTEMVCYYKVESEDVMLTPQDRIDLEHKYLHHVVNWSAGKKVRSLGGYGPEKFRDFSYLVQQVAVVDASNTTMDHAEMIKVITADFKSAGVSDAKTTSLGCRTSPLTPN